MQESIQNPTVSRSYVNPVLSSSIRVLEINTRPFEGDIPEFSAFQDLFDTP